MLTYGSLCSGIESATAAWHALGWTPAFFAEIEPFPCAVLAHHYPHVPNLGDMTKVNGREWRGKIDLLVAGTPCQDFSVAGKRAGFTGARGSLTFRFVELISESRPAWFVFENVPGILSGDCAEGFCNFLDDLEALGYVIDADILDAQHHGLAQRRRRVFVCGQHIEDLLRQTTDSSAQTIAQCLCECSLLAFTAARIPRAAAVESWAWPSADAADGLRRRMKLFGLAEENRWPKLLACLNAETQKLASAHELSALTPGDDGTATNSTVMADPCEGTNEATGTAGRSTNTARSWKNILADLSDAASASTTSTATSSITESQIYSCAAAAISTAAFVCRLNASCPTYWSAESSALIALAEFTSYARSAASSLFTPVEWVQAWGHFIGQAERVAKSWGCPRNWDDPATLLPFLEGLQRNTPPSREAGARVAGTIKACAGVSGTPNGAEEADRLIVAANNFGERDTTTALSAKNERLDGDTETFIVHSLRADGFDASEDGTGRGTPLVPVPILEVGKGTTSRGAGPNGCGIGKAGDPMFTLQAGAQRAIAFNWQSGGDCRINPSENVANGLQRDQTQAIAFTDTRGDNRGSGIQVTGDIANTLHAAKGQSEQKAIAFAQNQRDEIRTMDVAGAVAAEPGMKQQTYVADPFIFQTRCSRNGRGMPDEVSPALTSCEGGIHADTKPHVAGGGMAVRRLTPRECERVMGFPDDFTLIPFRGKMAADGNRYRALGNSKAVPVVRWIGERIEKFCKAQSLYQTEARQIEEAEPRIFPANDEPKRAREGRRKHAS